MDFIKRQMLETHMQDSRKIKLCDTVVDLDYFERLVKLYSQGHAAESISYSSPKDDEQQQQPRLARINNSVAMTFD